VSFITRQKGSRRFDLPAEFPLVDSNGVLVLEDRRQIIAAAIALVSMPWITEQLDGRRDGPAAVRRVGVFNAQKAPHIFRGAEIIIVCGRLLTSLPRSIRYIIHNGG